MNSNKDIDSEIKVLNVKSTKKLSNEIVEERHLQDSYVSSSFVSQSESSIQPYRLEHYTIDSGKYELNLDTEIARLSPSSNQNNISKTSAHVNNKNKLSFLFQCEPSMDGKKTISQMSLKLNRHVKLE